MSSKYREQLTDTQRVRNENHTSESLGTPSFKLHEKYFKSKYVLNM